MPASQHLTSLIRLTRMIALMASVVVSFACCHKTPPKNSAAAGVPAIPDIARLTSPQDGAVFTWGDSVRIGLEILLEGVTLDSIRVFTGNDHSVTYFHVPEDLYLQTEACRVGRNTARLRIYYNDSLTESHSVGLVLQSDVVPENYRYEVIGSYPHDVSAYTQGLFYHNGHLYESTGGYEGRSSIRIVDILTGKPEKIVSLRDPDIFGEGITPFNDLIYMVTYRSRVGFVYRLEDLGEVRSFAYQIAEGWGLTADSKNLIMSDGSQYLYLFEPEFFTQVDQMEVFDDKGPVRMLNELEHINGKILANIYGESHIVIIDAKTGKVSGRLDLDRLMPEGSRGDMGKVLNGIAYDPMSGHLYVTGKEWPVLYEIAVDPSL